MTSAPLPLLPALRRSLVLAVVLCGLMNPSVHAAPRPTTAISPRPTARAEATTIAIQVDGHLDESAWLRAHKNAGFVERKPRLRARPPERTWFSVLYDGSYLYIGVFCGEKDPSAIRARTTARDSFALFSDDAISIKIDAARDRRTTVGFVLNPAGARLDYRGVNEKEMRREFDTRWSGASARTPHGWTAEFRIPWSSLGVDPTEPPSVIGLNLSRDHAGRNATYDWALMPPPFSPISASLYGTVTGFEQLAGLPHHATSTDGGSGDTPYNVVPWLLVGGTAEAAEGAATGIEPTYSGGVDLSVRLGSRMRAQVTVNTDFAQVNVDDQVVNLSRFSLFMPEKREFFLRDVEVFTFGRRGSAQLFHSRRIGLNQGQPIPIFLGVKAVGRPTDALRFGVLNVVTRPPTGQGSDALPWSNHSVTRGQWQATDGSNVGLMWTHRQALNNAGDHNSVFGLDGAFRGGGTPLLIEGFTVLGRNGSAIGTGTADVGAVAATDPDAQRARAGTAVDMTWRGAVVRPTLSYSWFDDDFRADLGFYRRVGVHTADAQVVVEPRIGRYGLEKVTTKAWGNGVANTGSLLDRAAGLSSTVVWNSGFNAKLFADQSRITVQRQFTVGSSTEIDPGAYDHTRFGVSLGTPWVRTAAISGTFAARDYFGGEMLETSGSVVFRPGGFFRIEAGWSLSRVTFDDERPGFVAAVLNTRAAVGFSPELNLDLFAGWHRLNRQIPVNVRLRWTWRRGSDLFVVWQGIFSHDRSERQSLLVKWTWSLP
ncbi:MAG: carbohydrate binding family 9 domain-containing protein [Myxococcales bacterium]|nr:carbohydrate binding family 9 domain-containing protein [Myxococcales bacterium]